MKRRRKNDISEKESQIEQTKSVEATAHPEDGVSSHVDLDQQRRECMQRNQQVLQQLGLMPVMQSIQAKAAPAAEAKQAAPKRKAMDDRNAAGEERVLRRSLRTRGQEPDLPPLLKPLFGRPEAERPYGEAKLLLPPAKLRAPTAASGDPAKFDAHNMHRLRTMSDDAMRKRTHKITNTLKLKSLVQLLRQFGRDELAEEAQAALDARLANL